MINFFNTKGLSCTIFDKDGVTIDSDFTELMYLHRKATTSTKTGVVNFMNVSIERKETKEVLFTGNIVDFYRSIKIGTPRITSYYQINGHNDLPTDVDDFIEKFSKLDYEDLSSIYIVVPHIGRWQESATALCIFNGFVGGLIGVYEKELYPTVKKFFD